MGGVFFKKLELYCFTASHTKTSKLYFYKCPHFLLLLSLSTFLPSIPCIPTVIRRIPTIIPRIPTMIPSILTLIPRIPTTIPRIPTLITHIPTLIQRILIIPLILFPDSSFRLLQIAMELNSLLW